jgi:polyphenol oxidase
MGVPVGSWHLMHQVHGARVAVVDEATPAGAEIRGVDALVTQRPGCALVVQAADCVPVLLAGRSAVGAVHAGRDGLARGVVQGALDRLGDLGEPIEEVHAAIGPAIGGCCYEVPAALRDEVAADHPAAGGTTRWGTPSLDLPAAVEALLAARGVSRVERVGGCTYEDERFFSHRRDAAAGRQAGIVVREAAS